MAVTDPNTIDFMSVDEPTNTLILNIVEERPWSQVDQSWKELAAKLNFYIGALKADDFTAQVPEARGRRTAIRLICRQQPDVAALHALSLLKAGCARHDIPFSSVLMSSSDRGTPIDLPVPPADAVAIRPVTTQKPWWKFW